MSLLHHQDGASMPCFFYAHKAFHFSLFKQTPFKRKQALIKIRCGQSVGAANTPAHTNKKAEYRFGDAEKPM